MPTDPGDAGNLLWAVQGELILAGIGRKPGVAAGAGVHPVWVEPDASPAPGEKQGVEDDPLVTISLLFGGEVPRPRAAWERQLIVDIRLRSAAKPGSYVEVTRVDKAIRDLLIGETYEAVGVPLRWTPPGGGPQQQLVALEVQDFTGLQRLGFTDNQGWTHRHQFLFELLVS